MIAQRKRARYRCEQNLPGNESSVLALTDRASFDPSGGVKLDHDLGWRFGKVGDWILLNPTSGPFIVARETFEKEWQVSDS